PSATASAPSQLTVFTYNIQQGYDAAGRRNYEGQLAVARQIQPDIIGLQECDAARIANGNQDVVRYWADQLDYYSYYGPTTVAGTFGIALLSRYPIHNPRIFFMFSTGEQTACIEAQITVGNRTFTVFVTHLGNGGPLVQQLEVLQEVQGKENVILMGDFNFRPDTPQYRSTLALLEDAWVLRWPEGNTTQGVDYARTIDHIFVSPGTRVTDSRYLPGPASDHPALMAVIGW
ncbi:MAG TPA: endonuclease/exonuclease/phosphatase family protein, partial [Anaerolineae bacterium]|nr:endonuclease/exonuclease/phosphatase family protein [Anaerolineae bacterium]